MIRLNFLLLFLFVTTTVFAQSLYPDVQMKQKQYEKSQLVDLVPNEHKGKYGYVGTDGKQYIKPVFDSCLEPITFHGRKLPVCIGKFWGLLNSDGSYFVEPSVVTGYERPPIVIGDGKYIYFKQAKYYINTEYSTDVEYEKVTIQDKVLFVPLSNNEDIYLTDLACLNFENSSTFSRTYYDNIGIVVLDTRWGVYVYDNNCTPLLNEYSLPLKACKVKQTDSFTSVYIESSSGKYILDENLKPIYKNVDAMIPDSGHMLVFKNYGDYDVEVYEYANGAKHPVKVYSKLSTSLKERIGLLDKINKRLIRKNEHLVKESESIAVYESATDPYMVVNSNSDGVNRTYLINYSGIFFSGVDTEIRAINTLKGEFEYKTNDRYGYMNLPELFKTDALFDTSIIPKNSFERYHTCAGYDVIMNKTNMYSIPDYEAKMYDNKEYYQYVNTKLLTAQEKIHFDEVVKEFDNILFDQYRPELYLTTTDIPSQYKMHCEDANKQIELKKMKIKALERSRDIERSNVSTEWSCSEARDKGRIKYYGSSYVEEIWDGPNCYTYYVWGHSGFLFRQKKSQESYNRNKVEILVDDFDTNVYLPLEQMSGVADPSYENFNLKWKRKLGDDVYAIYDYSTKDGSVAAGTVIQCFGITQDALGRFVPDYRPVNLRKTIWKKTRYISRINKSGIGKILAFPESFEKIVPTPYFIKIISYDKILCLDYDFNTIFLYVREQGTTLTDCIMYEDKWIVTGSTTHNGYIGYDNYYVAVVDSNGDKLSESFLATKNAVITNIKETGSGEFVVSGKNHGDERIQISDDNTIVWLGNQNN